MGFAVDCFSRISYSPRMKRNSQTLSNSMNIAGALLFGFFLTSQSVLASCEGMFHHQISRRLFFISQGGEDWTKLDDEWVANIDHAHRVYTASEFDSLTPEKVNALKTIQSALTGVWPFQRLHKRDIEKIARSLASGGRNAGRKTYGTIHGIYLAMVEYNLNDSAELRAHLDWIEQQSKVNEAAIAAADEEKRIQHIIEQSGLKELTAEQLAARQSQLLEKIGVSMKLPEELIEKILALSNQAADESIGHMASMELFHKFSDLRDHEFSEFFSQFSREDLLSKISIFWNRARSRTDVIRLFAPSVDDEMSHFDEVYELRKQLSETDQVLRGKSS